MEIVRNFINVAGLADENNLPDKVKGQLIQYSEIDTIFIPDNQPDIKSIFQIMIKVEIRSSRSIKTLAGYTVILDGVKKLKIIYTQNDASGKAVFLDLELPYNTFVELPDYIKIDNIDVLILDAYFNLLDKRRIYSHLLYLVNVSTTPTESSNTSSIPESIPESSSEKLKTNIKETISIPVMPDSKFVQENIDEIKAEIQYKNVKNQGSTSYPDNNSSEGKIFVMCTDNENKVEKESEEILIDLDSEYL